MKFNLLPRFTTLVLSLWMVLPNAYATIHFVRSEGTGSGTSWADANGDLHNVLNSAIDGDTIWLSEGIYKPSDCINCLDLDRQNTFSINKEIVLIGGFPNSGNPIMEDRDPTTFLTVFSGDIGAETIPSDNSYNILSINLFDFAQVVIIDGVVFEDGNANGVNLQHQSGAAVHIVQGAPIMKSCIFQNNFATAQGGALYNAYGGGDFENCRFENNESTNGGAIALINSFNPIFLNNWFYNNTATNNGGVIYSDTLRAIKLYGCVFYQNQAQLGGGIYVSELDDDHDDDDIVNATIVENQAATGSFIYVRNKDNNDPEIHNTIFWSNSGTTIFLEIDPNTSSDFRIRYSLHNQSIWEDEVTLYSSTIEDGTSPFLDVEQGDLDILFASKAHNSGDEDDDLYLWGKDILGRDRKRMQIDMGAFERVMEENYCPERIYVNAAATGQNTGLSWEDAFTGFQEAIAMTQFCYDTEFWIAEGTYLPSVPLDNPVFNLEYNNYDSTDNWSNKWYGGFPDTGNPEFSDRDWNLYPTILSGNLGDPDSTSDNAGSILKGKNIYLDGFTITEGMGGNGAGAQIYGIANKFINCVFLNNYSTGCGAAIWQRGFSLELINCNLQNNYAEDEGGAIYARECDVRLIGCTISSNEAESEGGAIYQKDDDLLIRDCVFTENSSLSNGGAIYTEGTIISADHCTFDGNTSATNGGAISESSYEELYIGDDGNGGEYEYYYDVETEGYYKFSTFINNNAQQGGAIFAEDGSETYSTYSVFDNNTAIYEGGAIRIDCGNCRTELHSSTFSNNTATNGGAVAKQYWNTDIKNSLFYNNTANQRGGAIQSGELNDLLNCTFVNNEAGIGGDMIHILLEESVARNNIFWSDNTNPSDWMLVDNATTLSLHNNFLNISSCEELGEEVLCTGQNIFDTNNPFTNFDEQDFTLQGNAQAVNTGETEAFMFCDLDLGQHPRVQDSIVDMGAYERKPDCSIFLTSQTDIDNFSSNYPGLDTIHCDLYISSTVDDPIVNLTGLNQIISIQGFLQIEYTEISELTGLENLTEINDYLKISNNESLQNINAFNSLVIIGSFLAFDENNKLVTIEGFSSLENIGGSFLTTNHDSLQIINSFVSLQHVGGDFIFEHNEILTSIQGFTNLQNIDGEFYIYYTRSLSTITGFQILHTIGTNLTIRGTRITDVHFFNSLVSITGEIYIRDNDNLTTLAGLSQLQAYGITDVDILYNEVLSTCSEPFLCEYIQAGGQLSLYGNAIGCESTDQILFDCSSVGRLHVPFFYDLNENTLKDDGEPLLSSFSAMLNPGSCTIYSNSTIGGLKYLYFGDYSVSYDDAFNSEWQRTSIDDIVAITLDSINNRDTVYFGFIPLTNETNLSTKIITAQPRCNEYVNFDVLAVNSGTTTASGIMWLEIDENILSTEFVNAPDTIVAPNQFGWYITDLFPQHTIAKQIKLQFPSPPSFPIGDDLYFSTYFQFNDINGSGFTELQQESINLQCAYDPNDKLVSPEYPENYALIGEDLVYTIRFQNTGNAEAYNVIISDVLDINLDLSTFQYLHSSHEEVLSVFLEGNNLTFEFRDIFLPDSTANFEESQGSVTYSIRANPDIDEETLVRNRAYIVFDFNPSIVTNRTKNTMVSTFDFDEDGFLLWDDCDDNNALTNPDFTEIPYNGIDDDCDELTLDDDIDQDGFVFADDCDDNNPLINSDATEIPYNGIDDDCDELTLDDDLDQDGFPLANDCDDNNPLINSDATEIPYNGIDDDCDELTLDDDLDQDGFPLANDCDDNNPLTNSDATEIPYNGIDDDCDELTLDDDLDQDGFSLADDCDDNNPLTNPDATEIPYNGADDDCDPMTLDDDLDQDGFLLADDCDDNNPLTNPDATEIPYNGIDDDCDELTLDDDLDQDGFPLAEDCDDNNPLTNPDATEIPYNGIDDDCDALTLDDDLDQDGFPLADDCDDNNPLTNPDATEIPYNGIDDDCDELTLDDDLDQDGFPLANDCDDNNPLTNPDATEIPYNGIDDDCDELTLDDDLDQDGFPLAEDCDDNNPLANPAAEEIPNNGIDEDCDGEDLLSSTSNIIEDQPTIFPNPADNLLNITFQKNTTGTYTLLSSDGKALLEDVLSRETKIDVSQFAPSVYILLLKTEKGVWAERVIKI